MTIPVVGEEGAAIFEIPPMLLVLPCAAGTPPKRSFFVKKKVYALVKCVAISYQVAYAYRLPLNVLL